MFCFVSGFLSYRLFILLLRFVFGLRSEEDEDDKKDNKDPQASQGNTNASAPPDPQAATGSQSTSGATISSTQGTSHNTV